MNKRALILFMVVIIVAIIAIIFFMNINKSHTDENMNPYEEKCMADNCVSRIIDGDTFELRTGEKVRLICVDSPEIGKRGYEEAREFLSDLILYREVRLERDITDKDAYNRSLRYVYINVTNSSGEFEVFVNRELFQQGYAQIMRFEPDVKLCSEIKG